MSQFVILTLVLGVSSVCGGLEIIDSLRKHDLKNAKMIAIKYLLFGGLLLGATPVFKFLNTLL